MKYRTTKPLGRRNAFMVQALILFFCVATYASGLILQIPFPREIAYAFLLGQLLWALISWRIISGSLFNLYGLFSAVILLTHGSVAILELTGLDPGYISILSERMISSFTSSDIWDGYFLATIFLATMHLGSISAPLNNDFLRRHQRPHNGAVYLTSLILVSVGAVSLVIFAANIHANLGAIGYLAYNVALKETNTFALNLSYMLVAGSLLAISTARTSQIWPFIIAILIYILIFSVAGSRHKSIFVLLALLYALKKRGVKIPATLTYGFCAGSVLLASAWSSARLGASISFDEIRKNFAYIIGTSLSELGAYIYWVIASAKEFSSPSMVNFGISYVNAIFSSIPFGQRIFFDRDATGWWIAEKYYSQLVDQGYGFGTGYSLVAESYSSFWWLGFVPMFLFGYLIAFFSNSEKNSPFARAFIASITPYALFFPRDSSSLFIRGILWYGFSPLILYFILTRLTSAPKMRRTSHHKPDQKPLSGFQKSGALGH